MKNGVRAFGPPPLKQMTEDIMRAYKQTVDFSRETSDKPHSGG